MKQKFSSLLQYLLHGKGVTNKISVSIISKLMETLHTYTEYQSQVESAGTNTFAKKYHLSEFITKKV